MSIRLALLLFVFLAMLPLGVFAAFVVRDLGERARQAMEAQIDDRARVAALAVEERLSAAIAGLTALASGRSAVTADLPSLDAQARRYLASQDIGRAILLIDKDGQQLLDTHLPLGAALPKTGDVETVRRVFAAGEPQVTDVFIGLPSKQPRIAIDVPVMRDGAVVYDLRMGIAPQALATALDKQILPEGWIAILFDSKGTIIARSQGQDRFAGESVAPEIREAVFGEDAGKGTFVATVHEGFRIRATVDTIGRSQWKLVVGVPVHWLTRPGNTSLSSLAVGGVFALLLGLALAWVLARRIAGYTDDVATAAAELGAGRLPAVRPTALRELNVIIGALGATHALLETRDRQRDAAKREAEAANRAKSQFLTAVGHDLRQPVQSLFLYNSVLSATQLDDRQRKAVDNMGKALQAVQQVLNSLVDIARLDAGSVTPTIKVFPLATVTDVVDAALRPVALAKGLAFAVDVEPVTVRSDVAILGRITRNLVENAIKYTNHGEVRLRGRRVGDVVRIEVSDTGIGIPAEHLERVFDAFCQLDNDHRDREHGLGLGLAIVKRSADLLGHDIEVRSTPGQGSTFTVVIPL